MDPSLNPFIKPQGVVVVGASSNPSKLGYGVARNLVNSGFKGGIHFVSQRKGNLFGRPVHVSLQDVPDPVDLAVLIVPAPAVTSVLKQCQERNIHAAIVISSGFKEIGEKGALLEDEMSRKAKEANIRLLGPNCIGLLDTHYPLDTTFLPPPMPVQGDVAFISQSGAICAAIIDWARGQGIGFSRLISMGNQADLTETDMLTAVAEDENTRVLTFYIESICNGPQFVKEAARISRIKPIIALKAGRYESGQRAAASHTGALAGQDNAYQAAFEKAGVFRAKSSEEMFDWASTLASCPLPTGRRIAVLTNAGGPGVIAADALEAVNLSLAQLSPITIEKISTLLPPAAGLNNPIDMLASASPQIYAECLDLLLSDGDVDGVMVILPPPPMHSAEEIALSLLSVINGSSKPVVIALMGDQLIKNASLVFRKARIPEFRFPERAASALAVLAARAEFLEKVDQDLPRPSNLNLPASLKILEGISRGTWLDQSSTMELMENYGIPVPDARLAVDAKQAEEIAAKMEFPVVMKIASPDIQHKSDVGGIMLNIRTRQEAEQAYNILISTVKGSRPNAVLEGVHVQKMVPEGQEVIIGSIRDEQFGPMIMFGSGGVEVQGLKDISFKLAPLRESEIEDLLNSTWAGKKLHGFRNIPSADADVVKDILNRLSWMMMEISIISEIEINPLRVFANGAVALDVRVKV
ncbi:MAG TPA: acetate--CoA ligase family protein [Anaerolineales bacterium]|nr:acetate--CoA ligase family protein [Anaerolineales bacterium]